MPRGTVTAVYAALEEVFRRDPAVKAAVPADPMDSQVRGYVPGERQEQSYANRLDELADSEETDGFDQPRPVGQHGASVSQPRPRQRAPRPHLHSLLAHPNLSLPLHPVAAVTGAMGGDLRRGPRPDGWFIRGSQVPSAQSAAYVSFDTAEFEVS